MHIEAFLRDYKVSYEENKKGEHKCLSVRLDVDNTEENRVALATLSGGTVRLEPQQLPLPEEADA